MDLAEHSGFTNWGEYKQTESQPMVFWREEKTAVPEDKPLRAELRTKKPSSHMTCGSGNLRQLVAFGSRGTLKRRKRDKKKNQTNAERLLNHNARLQLKKPALSAGKRLRTRQSFKAILVPGMRREVLLNFLVTNFQSINIQFLTKWSQVNGI